MGTQSLNFQYFSIANICVVLFVATAGQFEQGGMEMSRPRVNLVPLARTTMILRISVLNVHREHTVKASKISIARHAHQAFILRLQGPHQVVCAYRVMRAIILMHRHQTAQRVQLEVSRM
jgi:hypothetical protein